MRSITAVCLIALLLSVCSISADSPGQPYSSYWHPNDLLDWSPATDPDAPFNRGNTPLVDRFLGDVMVNDHARANEAKIAALSIMYPTTSGNPSQGQNVFDVYAFNYWQYIDILVLWGGSAGEGLILAPNADVIDAGHRNGVPVYGTIFLPPTAYGGQIQWVHDLVQKDGETFPVADKLIEVAEYYRFDGWFINQETAGGDAALATQMRDFMEYIQLNSDVRIMWYDSMLENGNINWQNALNANNDMFFEDGGTISDEMFLNFWWNVNRLANSSAHAISLGRSPYELYAGVDVQANGFNTNVNWNAVFPEGESHVTSLGFYCPNWCFSSAPNHAKFYEKAWKFWSGFNRDPSNTEHANNWKGMAHYVPAYSVINDLPFVTNFNTGQGHRYAIDGQVLASDDWNNRSLQDILPTWRWIAECAGDALYPEMDWSDAYYGGNCLKVSGDIADSVPTHLKLFKTDLPVSAATELVLVYKFASAGTSTRLSCGVAFSDNPDVFEYYNVGNAASAEWNEIRFDLSAHAGKNISVLSLMFNADVAVPDYEIRIGRLAVMDGQPPAVAPPTSLMVDEVYLASADQGSLKLSWNESPSDAVYYNVFRVNPDMTRTYLGGTPNNAYFVQEINRVGSEATVTIEVETVGHGFNHSTPATAQFDWPEMPTPTPSPTATPTSGPMEITIELQMPAVSFGTGDECGLDLAITNPGAPQDADLYVLMEVFGEYWSYPTWISLNDGLDYETVSVATGTNPLMELLPMFQMPGVSAAGPFYFYGVMFQPGTLDVLTMSSNVSVYEFYLE